MSSLYGGAGASPSGRTGNKIPSGYKQGQIQQFDPQQMQLYNQQFANVGPQSYLSRLAGGDQNTFNQIEAPAMQQFNELQGGLASRFSGMGMGGRRSSGFQNTANQAGSDFAQQLQSNRQSLQRQALMDLTSMSQSLLGQRPYEQFLVEKQQRANPWAEFAGKLGGAIPGAVAGFATGGPAGAAIGGASGFMNSGGANSVGGRASMGNQLTFGGTR